MRDSFRQTWVSIILLLLPIAILGQIIDYSFNHLTQENGLSQGNNKYIYEDTYGFVWISSQSGLNRFDGQSVKVYQHQINNINSIAGNLITSRCYEDKSGNLWFTSSESINYYIRQKDQFERYSFPNKNLQNFQAFHLDKHHQLWIRANDEQGGNLYYFNIEKKIFSPPVFPLKGNILTVKQDDNGKAEKIIMSDLPNEDGLIILDIKTGNEEKIVFQKTFDGKIRKFRSPTSKILFENDSLMWVGLYNGLGVYNFKTNTSWIENITVTFINNNNLGLMNGIIPYNKEFLLVSDSDAGLLFFDKKNKIFIRQITFNTNFANSINSNNLLGVFKSSSNNLWVSTDGKGLSYLQLKKNKFQLISNTIGQSINHIWEDKVQNIWCSSKTQGTFVFEQNGDLILHSQLLDNKAKFIPSDIDFPLPKIDYFVEAEEKKNIWGVMDNNLLKWNQERKKFYFEDKYFLGLFNNITAFYKLKSGKDLIAINDRVYQLQLSENSFDTLLWQDFKPYNLGTINALHQDNKGHIYIGDNQNNLLIVKETTKQLQIIKQLSNIPTCHAFYEDEKNKQLWLATINGLIKLDLTDFSIKKLGAATDGLPNESFYTVLPDKKGRLWLSGNNGLIRYDPIAKKYHRYTVADGLQNPEFNPGAGIVSSSGDIWVGGINGLNVFKPETVQDLTPPPKIQLTNLLINDEQNRQYTAHLGKGNLLKLPYASNTISFELTAIAYGDPKNNQLEYKLEGIDKDWLKTGSKTLARYPNLAAGNYTLWAKAINSDGIPMKAPVSLAIHILTPFWQAWWFYLLGILGVAAIIYAIFQYRLEQALKLERLRVKISSDLHDDVGTLLSGLAMQTEILELTVRDKDKPRLQKIGELARSAMSRMRDTVWAIDARKDKMENLVDRMREHVIESLSPHEILFDFQLSNLDLKQNLPTQTRQNIYLIFKEAITNIAKHANATKVEIKLGKEKGVLEMLIKDNGVASIKDYKTTGAGLSNMKMRAKQIGAKLDFFQQTGFGIHLEIKI